MAVRSSGFFQFSEVLNLIDEKATCPTLSSYASSVMYVQASQDLETDRRRLQETLRREVEARKRVDRMLRGYKDEVNNI